MHHVLLPTTHPAGGPMSRASTPMGSTSRLGAASSQPQASISKPKPQPNPNPDTKRNPNPNPDAQHTGPYPSRCRIVKHRQGRAIFKGCPGWPWWMDGGAGEPGGRGAGHLEEKPKCIRPSRIEMRFERSGARQFCVTSIPKRRTLPFISFALEVQSHQCWSSL